ncbi:MAG: 4-(cytidine 5'-diphospho)-2-C-methyl-D-erythritol kinase [Candidatus Riflebacteria bacterium HGW-Riflebacteria-1]|jgi:4-diphosphocytidyl-2-C-methyl-D-erythritol kinase|nr:MAG: 4-(cytidine 5'-diphospho)-2-C-methyl-D-erythritol kinase [Candidatus Riflebacteria bacterium HGW-Riflebacteria-1]
MKKTLILQAPAKINIALWVKHKRPDGYHELASIMQTISLADTITLKEIGEPGIRIFCDNPDVPLDGTNLVHRAATVFLDRFSIEPRLAINIDKKIPVAAGLAGGSTDAAAVLTGLARLYDKAVTVPDIMNMATSIGSDVPFVVHGGLALAEGRGEILSFYEPPKPPLVVVIAVPTGVSVSTRWAYENYHSGNNQAKEKAFGEVLQAYRRRDIEALKALVFNDLESVTLHRHPEVLKIKELLNSTGEGVAMMSGSGPSVFALFTDRRRAMNAVKNLDGMAVNVFIEHITRKNT